jgi:hypothetical protein
VWSVAGPAAAANTFTIITRLRKTVSVPPAAVLLSAGTGVGRLAKNARLDGR